MLELVTTLLDTLALLLIAAGATAAVWPYVGPSALALGGLIVLAGSQLAVRRGRGETP